MSEEEPRRERWDIIWHGAKLFGAFLLIGWVIDMLDGSFGNSGEDCYYYSQHATDCF